MQLSSSYLPTISVSLPYPFFAPPILPTYPTLLVLSSCSVPPPLLPSLRITLLFSYSSNCTTPYTHPHVLSSVLLFTSHPITVPHRLFQFHVPSILESLVAFVFFHLLHMWNCC